MVEATNITSCGKRQSSSLNCACVNLSRPRIARAIGMVLAALVLNDATTLAAGANGALVCRGVSQMTCAGAACETADPATQNELSLRLGSSRAEFCYATSCWATIWRRLDSSAPDRLVVALAARSVLAGRAEQVQVSGAIDLPTLAYRATVIGDGTSIDVLLGHCACAGGEGDRACLPAALNHSQARG